MSNAMTLSDWVEIRDAAKAGVKAVSKNQSYTIEGVTYTRANVDALWRLLERAEAKIAELEGTSWKVEEVILV